MAELKTLLALVKGDVGLGNVDNTSDANKPVSSAQQTALDLKINKSILTAADDVLVGSGASTHAVVNLTASTIFGKKAAGGASALSPSERSTRGVEEKSVAVRGDLGGRRRMKNDTEGIQRSEGAIQERHI